MPDHSNASGDRPGRETPDADAQLRNFIRQRQTPESLQEDWDRLRGAHRMRSSTDASRINIWEEFKSALWLARVPQKLAWAAAVVAAVGVGWFALAPGAIRLRAPEGFHVAGVSLPEQLHFKPGSRSTRLTGSGAPLSGLLGTFRGGATGNVTVYDISFQGATTNGLPLVFNGSLVVTNAPGVGNATRQDQIRGALLSGELKIGDQAPVPVNQPFVP